jgi:hypothetical protein
MATKPRPDSRDKKVTPQHRRADLDLSLANSLSGVNLILSVGHDGIVALHDGFIAIAGS